MAVAILECLSLMALTMALTRDRLLAFGRLRVPVVAVLLLFFVYSAWEEPMLIQFPQYWSGFGAAVTLLGVTMTLLIFWMPLILRKFAKLRGLAESGQRILLNLLGLGVLSWTLPSILQPMDSFLNLGDGTEKVLDEIAAWVAGQAPGIDVNWGHNTMLGLPLWPLSLVGGHGELKIVLIVLWTNLLVLLTVFTIGGLFRRMVPELPFWFSSALAMISLTVSGSPINTSLFQELNYLPRLLLPLILCYLMLIQPLGLERLSTSRLILICSTSSLVAWNNIEFGFPAAMSCAVVLLMTAPRSVEKLRRLRVFLGVHLLVILGWAALGILHGEGWPIRRLGTVWGAGSPGSMGIHNNTGPLPPFSVFPMTLVLASVVVAVSVTRLRGSNISNRASLSVVPSMYLGLWIITSSVYGFYGVGSGAFRSQLYIVFFFLQVVCLSSLAREPRVKMSNDFRRTNGALIKLQFDLLPLTFLVCIMLAAVVQSPSGLKEWRRIQTPQAVERHLDEWSPERIDWISPEGVTELANQFGGESEVGWWFSYGHAVEILTEVENLMGTTAFEYAWRSQSFAEACRPLTKTPKTFIITHESAVEYVNKCDGMKFTSVSEPNVDGLVVLQITRTIGSSAG